MIPEILHRDDSLHHDDRGFTGLIDFVHATAIYVFALTLFIALSLSFLNSIAAEPTQNKLAAQRGADRLADDLLVGNPNAATLDRTCTDHFFTKTTGSCGFNSDWTTGSRNYLQSALHIHDKNLNVTIVDDSDSVVSLNGNQLTLGTDWPRTDETVYSWHRQAVLDYDGDSTDEWVTITVRVWR